MIPLAEVSEYVKGRQQDYAASRVLRPEALDGLRFVRDQYTAHIQTILKTLSPFVPNDINFEACVVDNCDVADTVAIDDGGQLICVSRHFLEFMRNFIELVVRGIQTSDDENFVVNRGVDDEDMKLFGRVIGEYLEIGAPLTFPPNSGGNLGPGISVSATEFVLAHEIVHRIEGDTAGASEAIDPELTGFQDFCRLRGREYRCDRKAVALTLARRRELEMPEMAFVGAICALMAISWVEQFTPGYFPGQDGSLHHPGSDSRVLRLHLEEQVSWRAAELDGQPNGLTGAVLRRAFRFLAKLESDPKLIASPLNRLIGNCISDGTPNHALFQARVGELFSRGRTGRVTRSLGAMWGASAQMATEERSGKFEFPQGRLACALFDQLFEQLASSSVAAKAIANEMTEAKDHWVYQ